ncbi:MAG: TraB/GumN family protein, partial [Gammaproteobacteria bacterium]
YMQDNEFYDQLLDRLINQRNYKMTETIHHLVSENTSESYFFAIGAGHFWGDNGIDRLLQEKGYTLEKID